MLWITSAAAHGFCHRTDMELSHQRRMLRNSASVAIRHGGTLMSGAAERHHNQSRWKVAR
jgi:hypothetical protein